MVFLSRKSNLQENNLTSELPGQVHSTSLIQLQFAPENSSQNSDLDLYFECLFFSFFNVKMKLYNTRDYLDEDPKVDTFPDVFQSHC